MSATLGSETIRPSFDDLVAAYCEALDRGLPVDRLAWIDQYPELAGELSGFFASDDLLNGLVAPLREAIEMPRPTMPGESLGVESVGRTLGDAAGPCEPASELHRPMVGDYELIRRLGRGAMGDVYEARQVRLNRVVALKMIRSGLLASEEDVQRFRNEAEAVALLDHPRIVTIHAVGEDQGLHYFSMRLIRGGSLAERIGSFRKDPRAAASLMIEVARAIQYAHQQGILHRDLKPANILVDENGQPHVSDFGLAKRLGSGSDLTGTGAILGTPSYMAPEQAEGNKGLITTRTDVYGLGALLYALLTGRAPFEGESLLETIEQVRGPQPPEPPSRLNSLVHRDLETICLMCLEKDPHRRYASGEDFADDLRRWLDSEPITARPVSIAARAWMWCRRNRKVAAFLVVASLLACVSTWQWLRAEGLRLQAERDACGGKIDQALALCTQGEVGRGLIELAETLRTAPRRSEDLKEAIRANMVAWAPYGTRLKGVLPHENQVYQVAYSPDGKTFVTVGAGRNSIYKNWPSGGGARLWNGTTCEPIGELLRHESAVLNAIFSPDSRLLATCGDDGTGRLWRVADGTPYRQPFRHGGMVLDVAFSPDGRTLLTGSTDGTARFWDVAAGVPLGQPLEHSHQVFRVGFGPHGRIAVTGCHDGRFVLWDVQTRKLISDRPRMRFDSSDRRPLVHGWPFSGDGARIITNRPTESSAVHGAQLWDVASGKPIGPVLAHELAVFSVALSRDGRFALTGSDDNTARLWSAENGRPVGQPLRNQASVCTVAFSPDSTRAVTATSRGIAQLWSVPDGRPLGDPMRHRDRILNVAFHPSGQELVTVSGDGTARVWHLPMAPEPLKSAVAGAVLRDEPRLAYSPDGRQIFVGYPDCTAKVRDEQTGFEIGTKISHRTEVLAVDWSVDGQRLLTGCINGTVTVWSARSGEPLGRPMIHPGAARSVAFSPDRRTVLTGGDDGTARLWDADTGKPIGPPLIHDAPVVAVAFSPDGRSLFSRTESRTVRRWDRATASPGSDERFLLWIPLATGTTLREDGLLHALDAEAWLQDQERLHALGGVPLMTNDKR
jgi:WD40 repeat protein/tRNA A-37 threonylcarbamoyl transferase component Bud32